MSEIYESDDEQVEKIKNGGTRMAAPPSSVSHRAERGFRLDFLAELSGDQSRSCLSHLRPTRQRGARR